MISVLGIDVGGMTLLRAWNACIPAIKCTTIEKQHTGYVDFVKRAAWQIWIHSATNCTSHTTKATTELSVLSLLMTAYPDDLWYMKVHERLPKMAWTIGTRSDHQEKDWTAKWSQNKKDLLLWKVLKTRAGWWIEELYSLITCQALEL